MDNGIPLVAYVFTFALLLISTLLFLLSQAIKRGIVEQTDLILVNKSDGDLLPAARRTASEYTSALKFMRPKSKFWRPQVSV